VPLIRSLFISHLSLCGIEAKAAGGKAPAGGSASLTITTMEPTVEAVCAKLNSRPPKFTPMNKNVLLMTVAAAALTAGASLASAQSMNTEQPKASAPMKSDSEKAGQSAQSPKKDADKAQTAGQTPKVEDAKKADDAKKAQGSKPQTTGQAPKADDAKKAEDTKKAPDSKPQTTGQAPKADDAKKAEDTKKAPDSNSQTTGQAPREVQQPQQQRPSGQAGGGAQAQISTEQRTQIRQTVMQVGDAPRVSNVNFSLSVGTVVPRTVKYVPLPSRVVEIYPAWRGYHFFIVGDQMVIVEPGSLRIVAVLPA
jgi:Protein of unknown function (DUF1236)